MSEKSAAVEDSGLLEPLFTSGELAKMWKFDESTIRRMFVDEPGVLIFGRQKQSAGKRRYATMRIPHSVAMRVYDRHTHNRRSK